LTKTEFVYCESCGRDLGLKGDETPCVYCDKDYRRHMGWLDAKIAFDIHGVLDRNLSIVKAFMKTLRDTLGCEVWILSGPPLEQINDELKALDVNKDEHFDRVVSIVDYLKGQNIEMWQNENGNWHCDNRAWWKSKGEICKKNDIDVIFDDSVKYADNMPDSTTFHLIMNLLPEEISEKKCSACAFFDDEKCGCNKEWEMVRQCLLNNNKLWRKKPNRTSGAHNMYDCPFSPGLQCSSKPDLCDKGKYEPHCVMVILRGLSHSQEINFEYVEKEGMIKALSWMSENDYWPRELADESVMSIIDRMLPDMKKEEEERYGRKIPESECCQSFEEYLNEAIDDDE